MCFISCFVCKVERLHCHRLSVEQLYLKELFIVFTAILRIYVSLKIQEFKNHNDLKVYTLVYKQFIQNHLRFNCPFRNVCLTKNARMRLLKR